MVLSKLAGAAAVRSGRMVVPMWAKSANQINRSSTVATDSARAIASQLPKLPVPDLNETFERLKISVRPFAADQEEFKSLLDIIDTFTAGTGRKLHSLLNTKDSQSTNWISHDWWLNKAYLEGRDPIMIWSNPGLPFPRVPVGSGRDAVAAQVTKTILAALDFRDFLKKGGDPENNKSPMCMDQYEKLFGTTRLPGEPCDSIHFGDLKSISNTIVVARKGHFYSITIPDDRDELSSTINSAIKTILAEDLTLKAPIGAFTALNRTKWAAIHSQLEPNAVNAITEALFVVSLDHISDAKPYNEDYLTAIAKQTLHADADNIGNRWFDKTLQLIFVLNADGTEHLGSGLNYEHTPCEAPIPARLVEHITAFWHNNQSITFKERPLAGDLLKKLNFGTSSSIEKLAKDAHDDWREFASSLDMKLRRFNEYGKEEIKGHRQSPDSWIQVAITWAYARLHNHLGGCYETAGTRKFGFGRTECIRSLTPALNKLFGQPNLDNLKAAISAHNQVAKLAANGQGIDRLLLGLNTAAAEVRDGKWKFGIPSGSELTQEDYELIDKLYKHELFIRSKHFNLSTSQVAVKFPDSFCCYGPLVLDGYGCCYNPTKNEITFAISAFKEEIGHGRSVNRFSSELEQTLKDMRIMFSTQAKL